jgi:hypothetical protein
VPPPAEEEGAGRKHTCRPTERQADYPMIMLWVRGVHRNKLRRGAVTGSGLTVYLTAGEQTAGASANNDASNTQV